MNEGDKIILVSGGVRSGKSFFAQKLAVETEREVVFIATAEAADEEMQNRINHHRNSRPKGWATIEAPYTADEAVAAQRTKNITILFYCITVFLSNILVKSREENKFYEGKTEEILLRRFKSMLKKLHDRDGSAVIIFVTNEVGMGIVPEHKLGREFRDTAGKINQLLANYADQVYFMISGIPVKIK